MRRESGDWSRKSGCCCLFVLESDGVSVFLFFNDDDDCQEELKDGQRDEDEGEFICLHLE